jgi:ribose transport system ATP-binding protein
MANPQLLAVDSVSKAFGQTQVLQEVSLSLARGEVLSIIGENGAGKSTLAKIIAGIVTPDAGALRLNGETLTCSTPAEATAAGIGIVHQELCLADNLTVAENIFLGREKTRRGFLNRDGMNDAACSILKRLGVPLDPAERVTNLSTGMKQMVEIARALSYNAQILIFDEPTSSLSDADAATLLRIITELRSQGVAIIYVSHRLAEVLSISDRIVCLKDGYLTGVVASHEATREKLISLIVGRELRDVYGSRTHELGEVALEVRDWRATPKHSPLTFSVRCGEIVAIAGLIGAGRTELLESIFGVRSPVSGSVTIQGAQTHITAPHQALQAGIALLPEDRKEQGLILESSIAENIILSSVEQLAGRLVRSFARESEQAATGAAAVRVRCAALSQPVQQLSGGNQQKVVLAKCLATNPTVLLLDEPTRGIDVGARCEIYTELRTLAAKGLAIVMVSSDLEEVIGLADRVLVMSEGALRGELTGSEISEQAVMRLASPASGDRIAA